LACALAATLLFWVTALARKGAPLHRASGRRFAQFIYAASATGGLLALVELVAPALVRPADPALSAEVAQQITDQTRQTMWLALYVLLIIVAPVQHGVAAVAAGPVPRRMRSWPHATLNTLALLASLLLLPSAIVWQQSTYLVVAPLGFVIGLRNLSYAGRPSAAPIDWQREHLTSMLTAGVTLHTTLLVFGTSRTLRWVLSGWTQWVPWVGPALIGLAIIIALRRRRSPWWP